MNALDLIALHARSAVLLSAIPDAPYRAALKLFHDELLDLASKHEQEVWLLEAEATNLTPPKRE